MGWTRGETGRRGRGIRSQAVSLVVLSCSLCVARRRKFNEPVLSSKNTLKKGIIIVSEERGGG